MARTCSGKVRTSYMRQKQKNGDIYVFERETKYDPEAGYTRNLSYKLIGKIKAGTTEIVPTRAKKKSKAKDTAASETAASRPEAVQSEISSPEDAQEPVPAASASEEARLEAPVTEGPNSEMSAPAEPMPKGTSATQHAGSMASLEFKTKAQPVNVQTQQNDLAERLKKIRLIITDVDGVLTDGGLYYDASGECLKRFNAHDGLGTILLHKAGIQIAVLSGRDCPALRKRLEDLNIHTAVLGRLDKSNAIAGILGSCAVAAEEACYIGDDVPDAQVFPMCGVSATVADAPDYVKDKADIVLKHKGGEGAFRELADLLFVAKGLDPFVLL